MNIERSAERAQHDGTAIETPYGTQLGARRWAAIAVQQPGQFTLVHEGAAVGRIMGDLGMPLIANATGNDTPAARYSTEQINLLANADKL